MPLAQQVMPQLGEAGKETVSLNHFRCQWNIFSIVESNFFNFPTSFPPTRESTQSPIPLCSRHYILPLTEFSARSAAADAIREYSVHSSLRVPVPFGYLRSEWKWTIGAGGCEETGTFFSLHLDFARGKQNEAYSLPRRHLFPCISNNVYFASKQSTTLLASERHLKREITHV